MKYGTMLIQTNRDSDFDTLCKRNTIYKYGENVIILVSMIGTDAH